ncbi:MAG: hypothetical protein DELT_02305 [Desulfovibrio sp.]
MYNPLRRLKQSTVAFIALAAFLVPVQSCHAAADEIKIPSTFTHIMLTKQTVAPEVSKCLPAISKTMLSSIEKDFPQSGAISTVQSKEGFFIIMNTNGYCIQKSANNYPILATEAFYKTANPPSKVPTEVTEKWYTEIATLIAKKGNAKVAYVFSNGNAMLVDYSVKDAYLLYPHSFKKAGEWESEKIDLKYSDKMMDSFDATEYNKKPQKSYLLAHRR